MPLLPGYGLRTRNLHLLRLLHQCAQCAAADEQQIVDRGARDSALFPDLAADLQSSKYVHNGHDVSDATGHAALSNSLGVLPEGVAWYEVGDDAQPEVVEAAEESVLPVCRHDDVYSVRLARNGNNKKIAEFALSGRSNTKILARSGARFQ